VKLELRSSQKRCFARRLSFSSGETFAPHFVLEAKGCPDNGKRRSNAFCGDDYQCRVLARLPGYEFEPIQTAGAGVLNEGCGDGNRDRQIEGKLAGISSGPKRDSLSSELL
jgi:hypothetical protein